MSCKGCVYAILLSGVWYCDYLLITGHRRPCPPGEGCTVRKAANLTKRGSTFMRRREWDTEKAKALYDQKLSDAEIAGNVGATASAVAYWRRGLGLPANPGQRPPPQEDPEPKVTPPPPASPPLRPLVLPANGVPAANQRSVCGGERRKEWSGRSPRRQAGPEQSGISSDEGPVELSIEMDGHAFALRAPDLEGAERIYEYAGRLLKDMGQATAKLKEGIADA